MDSSRDLVDPCSYNGEKIVTKFSGFSQAVSNHFFLGDVPELGDGLVVSNSLLDADDVSKQPLVLARFQVVHAAEEVLIVGDG